MAFNPRLFLFELFESIGELYPNTDWMWMRTDFRVNLIDDSFDQGLLIINPITDQLIFDIYKIYISVKLKWLSTLLLYVVIYVCPLFFPSESLSFVVETIQETAPKLM